MKIRRILYAVAVSMLLFSPAYAWVQGPNGHWYQAVRAPRLVSWKAAFKQAHREGAYLATITSPEENDFVFRLINHQRYWHGELGPLFGGYQPAGSEEPAGGWSWVTGEPWDYTNWAPGQPDDGDLPYENIIHFWNLNSGFPDRYWNDRLDDQPLFRGYVLERKTKPFTLLPPLPHPR